MAKFLRVLPSSQTTTTNGSFLLDPNMVLHASATADNVITLQVNNLDTSADVLSITLSASDPARRAHRVFLDALCAAASYQKAGVYYDLPDLISGTGTTLTITTIAYG